MIGIIIVSHGNFAEGMVSAAKMIYGDAAKQVVAIGLKMEESSEDFQIKIEEAIKSVDTGEGVVILADLLGGTPCNKAAAFASDKVQIVTGVNLGMLLELLGIRQSASAGKIAVESLLDVAKNGMVDYNTLLKEDDTDEIV